MVKTKIKLFLYFVFIFLIVGFVNASPYVQLKPSLNTHNNSNIANDPNIVGNWWFEQNATNMADPTINNGTIYGAVNSSGIVGYAYEFDGAGDIIKTGFINLSAGASQNLSNFSVSVWVELGKNNSGTRGILSTAESSGDRTGYFISYNYGSGNAFGFYIYKNSGTSSLIVYSGVYTGGWHHLVMTYNGTTLLGYADGNKLGTTATGTGVMSNQNFTIGKLLTDFNSYWFNGTIDEVQIWNRTLSSGEISSIYNTTLSGYITILPNENKKPYVQLGEVLNFE